MRYAIATETYPPEVNGVALTVHGLETGLRARGHQVDVVRPRQAADSTPADTVLVRGASLPRYPGLKFGLPATRRLTRHWATTQPDAIYVATEGPLGWSAMRAARRLGIPVATGFHTRFDEYLPDYGAAWLQGTALRWMRRFHNQAEATLVPTRELQQFLRGSGFERVQLLARAVDSLQFDPSRRDPALRAEWGIEGEGFAAIYVGRIANEKNLPLAIRAFRKLQQLRPKARFVWVGDGPAREKIADENPDFIFAASSAATRWRGTSPAAICSCFPAAARPSVTSPWKRWPAAWRRWPSITVRRANTCAMARPALQWRTTLHSCRPH